MTTTDDTSGGDVLAAGTRLEEFEIERELGAGGFGVTYLAHDRSLDRLVAIKEYLPHDWGARGLDGAVGPRATTHAQDYRWGLERFLDEARVLARLHHPHIVQVYRVIEARGTAYMVTEYLEGRSLAAALRAEGPWAEARVVSLLDALTSGLAAVHGAGLVHRDVKPANVMLRDDGSPVLIDFGAARQAVGGRSRSVTAVLTPGYAPFEQYSTKGVQGPWTDVYALGAVAYEALSGRVPEEAPERVADDSLRPVAEATPQAVSARVSSAVMSALALRREDRPQRLEDWRVLLGLPARRGTERDAGARAPVPAGLSESGPAAQPSRPVGALRRRRLAVAAALAAVALSAAGVAWWVRSAVAPETAGTVARAPVEAGRHSGVQSMTNIPDETREVVRSALRRNGMPTGDEAVAEFFNQLEALPRDHPKRVQLETWLAESAPASSPGAAGGEENAVGAVLGAGVGRSGSEVSDVGVSPVAPEAAEEALSLDRAGWRRIQQGLVALGLDPGTPDGLVGGGTRRAVRAYQEGAGKPATGFLDAADVTTLQHAALEAAEAERQRLAEAEAAADAERQRLAEEAEAAAEAERLAKLSRPGRMFRDCDGCPEMVVIPAGEFRMGSPASEEGRRDEEGPQHRVTLRSFALGVTEVTFDEWEACVRGGGCNGRRPDDEGWGRGARPVIRVSWEDAQAYVSWLSELARLSYRLPSESEWEYAARAGTTTPFTYGRTISTNQVNYNGSHKYGSGRRGTYRERTTPVKTFAPNAFGLYDVHGNVWEWVEDCWHDSYRGTPSDGTVWLRGGNCSRRVLRGGSWLNDPRVLRSAARNRYTTETRLSRVGFRVARTLD